MTTISLIIVRSISGLVFVVSAFAKIQSPYEFKRLLFEISIAGTLADLVLWFIIILEIILSIILIFKPRLGFLWSGIFLSLVTLGVLMLYLFGVDLNCGCFGKIITSQISLLKVFENIVFAGVLFGSWFSLMASERNKNSIQSTSTPSDY